MSKQSWSEAEPVLREYLTRAIEAQPELLLEHAGGPEGLKADVILATLYGFDGQVDAEWRIARVEPVLLRPLQRRPTLDEDASPALSVPVARYELQSNWATLDVDWLALRDALPRDVRPAPASYLVKVALVRYRRFR